MLMRIPAMTGLLFLYSLFRRMTTWIPGDVAPV